VKKKVIIIAGVLAVFLISLLFYGAFELKAVSKEDDVVTFTVNSGMNKFEIVSELKDASIIKNKYAALAYIFFNPKLNLQAGKYELNRKNSAIEILKQINDGKIVPVITTVQTTFVEGNTIANFGSLISSNFDIAYDEFMDTFKDEEFLNSVIEKYWFVDESILNENIYFALEGYLYPNTYEFYKTATSKDIIIKMLDGLDAVLTPLKEQINSSKYSVHEILTMASIIEKEALNKIDREKVSQVIYKRLDTNMHLGMDVTTYYAVFKEMGDILTSSDLNSDNAYNTRNSRLKGLPVGPICNPSSESIIAALNPSDTDYIYFIADVNTGKVYFASTYEEFLNYKNMLG